MHYIFALLLSIGLLVGCAAGEEPESNQEAQTEQTKKVQKQNKRKSQIFQSRSKMLLMKKL